EGFSSCCSAAPGGYLALTAKGACVTMQYNAFIAIPNREVSYGGGCGVTFEDNYIEDFVIRASQGHAETMGDDGAITNEIYLYNTILKPFNDVAVGEATIYGDTQAGTQFTGSISGTTRTVTAGASGTLSVGDSVYATGVTANDPIISQLSGAAGGIGTYTITQSQTVSSRTMFTTAASVTNFEAIGNTIVTNTAGGNPNTTWTVTGSINGSSQLSVTGLGGAGY